MTADRALNSLQRKSQTTAQNQILRKVSTVQKITLRYYPYVLAKYQGLWH